MFESHFGLRENPFTSGHKSQFVYPSHEHQEALAHLRYGIMNLEPFVLITGEVGTGKTTALFEALIELQSRVSVALITNSTLTRGELLEEICLRFGVVVTAPSTKPQALTRLEQHLLALRGRGERAILLLDEAQNFDRELLEEIRLLSNLEASGDKLVQIILVGQPELETNLALPELRQLRQRIPVHYRLRPLNLEDTECYIRHRISVAGGDGPRVFPSETCAEVYAVTNGIPREINHICAQAMLDAYVEGMPCVSPKHVHSAAQETTFQSVLPRSATDPDLPPLPAWPTAVPLPSPAAPTMQPEAPPSATDANPVDAWAPSPARRPQSVDAFPESPAPAALTLEAVQKIEVPRVPEPLAAPPQGGPGTRYAAESALKPPFSGTPLRAPGAPGARPPRVGTPPSRLYNRMRDEAPEPPAHAGIKWLIGLAVVAVVVIAAILVFRFGPWAKPELPAPPTASPQAMDSSAADTTATIAPPQSMIAGPAATTQPQRMDSGVADESVALAAQEFNIAVGMYPGRALATSELARIVGACGLSGRVARVRLGGAMMYGVFIGSFLDRGTADRKASELVSSGAVDEARVLPRGPLAKP